MELLISSNINSIRKVYNKDLVVTTSTESAAILLEKHNYDALIYDDADISPLTGIASRKGLTIYPYSEYLSTGNTVSKLTATLRKTLSKPKTKRVYKQTIISIWSVKGGVGRTTLAKTLAETLPTDLNILILDLNFQDGGSDLSYMLHLPVLPHMGMYLKNRTKEAFEANLVEFRNNIYIMQTPPRLNLAEGITPGDIKQMIDYARTMFDFIIIDLPNKEDELVQAALQASNKVLMLTSATEGEIKRIMENCRDYDYTLVVTKPASRMWRTLIGVLNAPVIQVDDLDRDAEQIIAEVV
ncbi:AAA family ATPase [Mahella australiensis]|uniref:AAA domain-containing protein n=1 Tax=Mahella australiensis (strain DSM 15567 / CIP 107919 / 50-1 BON) TaxID=697281 RepID=F3ZWT6_MAHA5|nr:AAA family ATPase [Mahella australiensis]AEE97558.1 hypothetical protein Mahau_2394 [Mahella australiensis 50-1 BON]